MGTGLGLHRGPDLPLVEDNRASLVRTLSGLALGLGLTQRARPGWHGAGPLFRQRRAPLQRRRAGDQAVHPGGTVPPGLDPLLGIHLSGLMAFGDDVKLAKLGKLKVMLMRRLMLLH
jgi:hypothetical protein